jgi:Mn2+/Fe2+ NRAMP family transporter
MISVVLPFVIFPLVWLCADEKVMTVRNAPSGRENECVTVVEAVGGSHSSPEARSESVDNTLSGDIRSHELVSSPSATLPASGIAQATRAPSIPLSDKLRLLFVRMFWLVRHGSMSAPPVCNTEAPKLRSFKSHWSTTAFGYAFFTVVTVANAYVLLMLMIGKG